jgi:hypothetical protein
MEKQVLVPASTGSETNSDLPAALSEGSRHCIAPMSDDRLQVRGQERRTCSDERRFKRR